MRKKQTVGKWDKLPEEWRTDMMAKDGSAIRAEIARVALNQVALEAAQEADPDLPGLKEALAEAMEQYVSGRKQNRLRIAFLGEVLAGRGEVVPGAEEFLRAAKDGLLNNPGT